ncbi:MAG: hypothetical protein [Ixodes ricinus orinovirus-like virus 1]|uniref:Uncharacterized protein n=1 Tax=Ixodes ricinus orinovirus-like virus 1 TaxID=2950736 RepID=A0AAE9LUK8_9MONO|nr:MAG: hypothetical protein [Ixodes ricinus orinovirus-like virus 1]
MDSPPRTLPAPSMDLGDLSRADSYLKSMVSCAQDVSYVTCNYYATATDEMWVMRIDPRGKMPLPAPSAIPVVTAILDGRYGEIVQVLDVTVRFSMNNKAVWEVSLRPL